MRKRKIALSVILSVSMSFSFLCSVTIPVSATELSVSQSTNESQATDGTKGSETTAATNVSDVTEDANANEIAADTNENEATSNIDESVTTSSAVSVNENCVKPSPVSSLTAPTGLDICGTKNLVILSWDKVKGAESYNVYRSTSRYGTYTMVGNVKITKYLDKDFKNTNYYYKVEAVNSNVKSDMSLSMSQDIKLFGQNVYIFDQNDSADDIQNVTSNLFDQQEAAQFDDGRYAVLFKPGSYSTNVHVGFYTQVAGLGLKPDDTAINNLLVDASWLPDNDTNPNNATCNFWRSAENLAVKTDSQWAVSQAAPLRRVHIEGNLRLHAGGWASGGFLSDSKIDGTIDFGGQQQWFTRNSDFNDTTGGSWNMVYTGVNNNPPVSDDWVKYVNTVVDKTPVVAEKPFLYIDDSNQYNVFVPKIQTNSKGITWDGKKSAGKSISLDDFYVAHPETDTAGTINAALARGKNLLLTPGIYHVKDTIRVTRPDTVVLGMGYASIVPENGVVGLSIADVDGVRVAGIIMDAGSKSSPSLMQVGPKDSRKDHSKDPTVISDLVCRIGGDLLGKVTTGLEINSNNVIGDDLWVWRADHGAEVAWDKNTAKNGMVVNGDNVTMYGLMVEHFQEYQTLWNGNGGRTYFYQSEIPYEVPSQDAWMSHNGTVNGYSSFKVADKVKSFEGWGFGIYCYFNQGIDIYLNSAMEVPNKPDVKVHHILDLKLTGNPGITHVINNTGDPAYEGNARHLVLEYCNNEDPVTITPYNKMLTAPTDVTITSNDKNAYIMYTTDGSIPTSTNGIKYTGPFTVSQTTTVNAVACKKGMNDSIVTSSKITIDSSLANDLAFGKTVVASSGNASLAVDGDVNTRWESNQSDPQWMSIDLGKAYDITGVKLDWEYAAAKDYKIQVSDDGINWTDVCEKTGLEAAQHRIDDITFDKPASGRYIRMYGESRSTIYGYSIWEFKVSGN